MCNDMAYLVYVWPGLQRYRSDEESQIAVPQVHHTACQSLHGPLQTHNKHKRDNCRSETEVVRTYGEKDWSRWSNENMEDESGWTPKDRNTKTEVEGCYIQKYIKEKCVQREKMHKTEEHGEWKLDAPTPNREKGKVEVTDRWCGVPGLVPRPMRDCSLEASTGETQCVPAIAPDPSQLAVASGRSLFPATGGATCQ